jgi:stress-induced morphogen
MITTTEVITLIQSQYPDAKVDILDKTGMSDHFIVRVVTPAFEGVGIMDRHRLIMKCLETAMQDGRLHAVEIQTATA